MLCCSGEGHWREGPGSWLSPSGDSGGAEGWFMWGVPHGSHGSSLWFPLFWLAAWLGLSPAGLQPPGCSSHTRWQSLNMRPTEGPTGQCLFGCFEAS